MDRLTEFFGVTSGSNNDQVDLDFCSCTGYCEQGSNVIIDETHIIHEAKRDTVAEKIQNNETVKMFVPDLDEIAKDDFLGEF